MNRLRSTLVRTLAVGIIAMMGWLGGGAIAPGSPALANPVPVAALPGFKAIFSGSRPDNIGITAGHLAPCPSSPNCVVSQGGDEAHAIAPLTYPGDDAAAAMALLATVVAAQPRTEIVEQTDTYLAVEFSSRLMGFVDDGEFYADPTTPGIIHLRSAARLGESDLGVNRDRIETIRADFTAALGLAQGV